MMMTTADKIKYILQKTGWTRDQFASEKENSAGVPVL